MPAYRVLKPYRSSGAQLPTPGAVVELAADLAAWVERDSPGTLAPHVAEPELTVEPITAGAPAAPAHDRMVHGARRRGPRKDAHDG